MGALFGFIVLVVLMFALGWIACLMLVKPREHPFTRNGDGWLAEMATNENGMLVWAEMVPSSNRVRGDVVAYDGATYEVLNRYVSGGIVRHIVRKTKGAT